MKNLLPEGMTGQDYYRLYLYLHILNECTPEDEVLEIGCGDGEGPAAQGPPLIAEKVYDYVCIDKRRYNNPPFNFVQADIEEYGLTGVYDKVIALYVIQYVDPEKLFKLVSERLKPGGVAYFSEGCQWYLDGPRLPAREMCNKTRWVLKKAFNSVEIKGINDGIIVPEEKATTGVFAICTNKTKEFLSNQIRYWSPDDGWMYGRM